MIKEHQSLPDAKLSELTDNGMLEHSTHELFSGKKALVFALPGAFTPTCSAAHLPGYVTLADQFFEKGIDFIACVSVNDAFVMKAWGDSQNAEHIKMLADGDGSFTKALGLDMDTGSFGGVRSQRYAMIVDNGVVTALNVEAPKAFEVSSAEAMFNLL
ncbi:peroxiredoxin [Parashewanella curva]|uniref:Glutathione-dependent peroxiredoxin n=1 Tax=Parashewanella curva TaxID=2338552 RepID=A0A3L8PZH0_9GAMM|nr:peroxiredoxin [Parashewanella curva]RLV60751.1 peroxiredoxin [Parashewanella curva]